MPVFPANLGGTGLGLSVSRQICQAMGGDISVRSHDGVGSTFAASVRLSPCTAPRQGDHDGEDDWLLNHPPLNVLVAEDNATNRIVLTSLLKKYPLRMTMAEDGKQALQLWRDERFDVVFMDVNMPEMDGVAATYAIRQEEKQFGRARIPILGMSANAMAHQVEGYLECGMDLHVAKPMRRTEIVAALRQVLLSDLKRFQLLLDHSNNWKRPPPLPDVRRFHITLLQRNMKSL